jgi:hypothetical protein
VAAQLWYVYHATGMPWPSAFYLTGEVGLVRGAAVPMNALRFIFDRDWGRAPTRALAHARSRRVRSPLARSARLGDRGRRHRGATARNGVNAQRRRRWRHAGSAHHGLHPAAVPAGGGSRLRMAHETDHGGAVHRACCADARSGLGLQPVAREGNRTVRVAWRGRVAGESAVSIHGRGLDPGRAVGAARCSRPGRAAGRHDRRPATRRRGRWCGAAVAGRYTRRPHHRHGDDSGGILDSLASPVRAHGRTGAGRAGWRLRPRRHVPAVLVLARGPRGGHRPWGRIVSSR